MSHVGSSPVYIGHLDVNAKDSLGHYFPMSMRKTPWGIIFQNVDVYLETGVSKDEIGEICSCQLKAATTLQMVLFGSTFVLPKPRWCVVM